MMHNAFLLQRFIAPSGIRPNKGLFDMLVKELIEFAAIAARCIFKVNRIYNELLKDIKIQ
ncbi:hypothetical protein BSYN_15090 [Bacteroides sedimenti]|uniref:Uncharacterized protein n=1 Tax=Bacteroides sedimenti TaxID=2136147 RepID=A0ABN6Z4Y1_9BACE